MQITKEQVKSWSACTDGYRWFLEKFPQGGAYADVHGALMTDKRFDDARWLVDKMYRTFLDSAEFIKAETAAIDQMTKELTNMEGPSDKAEGEKNSGYYAQISATGKNSVVACASSVKRIVLGEGGCVAIPWHDGERTRFAVDYVGENDIEANTPYVLNDEGQFVKIEE
ncbi:hypothetical protein JQR66_000487 [Salmonella enterica]|nr:hypothetical protein [Salmonella enterica]EJB9825651.1 hypothetical protein [Salmonella enterica]